MNFLRRITNLQPQELPMLQKASTQKRTQAMQLLPMMLAAY